MNRCQVCGQEKTHSVWIIMAETEEEKIPEQYCCIHFLDKYGDIAGDTCELSEIGKNETNKDKVSNL